MIAHKTIYIKNIYYMLSYAFQVLKEKNFKKIEAENFDDALELLSEILIIGVSKQIKQGLIKDYIDFNETTSSIRGKIEITESINRLSFLKGQLNCTYDEFSLNCYLNQILKSTLDCIIKSDISQYRKKKLRNLMVYLQDVDVIDVNSIDWKFRFDRNNQNYKMLMYICYLVLTGLIPTEKAGSSKLLKFEDNQLMSHLYEKFILNYYDKEHHELMPNASYIDWQVDDGFVDMLPKMKTDVTLKKDNKILIIDAKFYSHNTQKNFDVEKHRSGNLYQIFTYVKNKEIELQDKSHEISGMLLYAKTNEDIQPDSDYLMSGNKISVKTLDLNQDFNEIKNQLEEIVLKYF